MLQFYDLRYGLVMWHTFCLVGNRWRQGST